MAGEDPKYIRWLRSHKCCKCNRQWSGAPHHITGAGWALREHDHNAIPMCPKCHRDLHDLPHNGAFGGWTGEMLRDWQKEQVAHYQAKYIGPSAVRVIDELADYETGKVLERTEIWMFPDGSKIVFGKGEERHAAKSDFDPGCRPHDLDDPF